MNKSVPAEINNNSIAIFIAQAPGYYENEVGVPLVGNEHDKRTAGNILIEILESLGYVRTDFSYTNVYDKFPGKKSGGYDIAPDDKKIREEFPRINEDIVQSNCDTIFTLGNKASKFLKEMQRSKLYGTLNNKKIISLPYPNNKERKNLKEMLKVELKNHPHK